MTDRGTAPSSQSAARSDAWRLSEVDLFQDLSPADMAVIEKSAPMREVETGSLLFAPGSPHEVLFFLKRGRVRLYRLTADGRSLTMSLVEQGQVFGEMELLGQSMEGSHAETLEPSLLCVMSRADVYGLLLADARIAARIATTLGRRVADLEQRLEAAVFSPVPSRIASTLVTLAAPGSGDIRLTHEQLAGLVGTTRETTTKVLGDLRDRRVVDLRRGRIRVLDSRLLESLSNDPAWTTTTGGHSARNR